MSRGILQEIKKILEVESGSGFINKNKELYLLIKKDTDYLPAKTPLRCRIWHIEFGEDLPKCLSCDNPVIWGRSEKKYNSYCSPTCSGTDNRTKEKRKETNLKKYGVDNPINLEEIKNKRKETNLKKYGVESFSKTQEFREKCKKTCVRRYGVENYSQTLEYKEKCKKTSLERYGSEHYTNRDLAKKTSLERYGVENYSQIDECKEKIKETNLERYGAENYSQTVGFKDTMRKISLRKYKREFHTQKHLKNSILDKLNDRDWLMTEHILNKKSMAVIGKELGLEGQLIKNYLVKHGIEIQYYQSSISIPESQLSDFFFSIYEGKVVSNDRKLIQPYELDIYLPDLKLAFEFNGIYWHSELQGTDRNYHLNKTNLCKEKGIRLVHIFESEWELKQDIVKSRISNLLGLSERIYARKCKIREVNTREKNEFLNESHIQGSCSSSINLGLYLEDELVSLMTFGKSRFSKKYEWELIRYCNKLGTSVVGGASRLFKRFTKEQNPKSIVSYSDKRWNTGDLYLKLGFTHSHTSKPNFFYFKNCMILESRQKYQKHKLEKVLESYDPGISANMNMQNNGYNRIWDCGNEAYVWYEL